MTMHRPAKPVDAGLIPARNSIESSATPGCKNAYPSGSGLGEKQHGGAREQANPAGCEPASDRIDTGASPQRRCSSVVEQPFCKRLVAGSIPRHRLQFMRA
jgi:hypothetical protein